MNSAKSVVLYCGRKCLKAPKSPNQDILTSDPDNVEQLFFKNKRDARR